MSETMPNPRTTTEPASLPEGCAELHAIAFAITPDPKGRLVAPKWVQLSPAGDAGHESALPGERVVRGRDGREFAIGDVKRVIAATELPMPFDWDHESVSWGGSTKAAGWIDLVEYVEKPDAARPAAGFWGRVERWTPEGRASIEDGYFRGLSPVVRYEYREPREKGKPKPPPLLVGFVNVALTNRPNLRMGLLNREGATEVPPRLSQPAIATPSSFSTDPPTDPREAVAWWRERAALADRALAELPESELARRVHEACHEGLAVSEKIEAAHARVAELEAKLAEQAEAAFREQCEAAFDAAFTSGKIPPVELRYFRESVRDAASLEAFRGLMAARSIHPILVPLPPDPVVEGDDRWMTKEEREVAHTLGISDSEWKRGAKGGSRG